MHNYAVIRTGSGYVRNALSTNTEGVFPVYDAMTEILSNITRDEFEGFFNDRVNYQYYNFDTGKLEPIAISKWVLKTEAPYYVGVIPLVIEQQHINGGPVTIPVEVNLSIDGVEQVILVDDGLIELSLECSDPEAVQVVIKAYRHEDFLAVLEVIPVEDPA